MATFDEQRLVELLGALPPAPDAWVAAAKELPLARRELDHLVERAVADEDFRHAIEADIEAAIRHARFPLQRGGFPVELDDGLAASGKKNLRSSVR